MRHETRKSATDVAVAAEVPALLLPGGSCSELCRSSARVPPDARSRAHEDEVRPEAKKSEPDTTSKVPKPALDASTPVLVAKLCERYVVSEDKGHAPIAASVAAVQMQKGGD